MSDIDHIKNALAATGVLCAIAVWTPQSKCYTQTVDNLQNTPLMMQYEISGTGTPVVLVGGGLTGWKSWEPFVETFVSMKRQVVRVQLISVQYGLEDRALPANYTVKTESRALAATLDSLQIKKPVDIVAWSFGAFASLDYALDHPEHIRSLTLIEPPAMWVLRETGKFDAEVQKAAEFFQTLHGEMTEDILAEFLRHAGLVEPGRSAQSLPQWDGWVPFRRSLRNCPAVVSHRDEVRRLELLQQPVLLVKGTGSTAWLHNVVDVLSEYLPNSRVVEYAGGHAPHIVSRRQFLLELYRFYGEME